MRNKFLTAAILLASLNICNTASAYEIKGKITGVKSGRAILTVSSPKNLAFSDTVKISNGKFTFKGTIKDAVYASLSIQQGEEDAAFMSILLEEAPIQISADWSNVIERYGMKGFDKSDLVGGANTVLSTKQNKLYKTIVNQDKYSDYRKAMDELDLLRKNDDAASKAKFEKMKEQWEPESEKIDKEFNEASIALIKENKNTEYSAYILKMICGKLNLSEIETVFNQLTPKVQNSFFAQDVREEIKGLRAVAPGQPAPEFTLKAFDGSTFSLSSLRGKYVVVDFWASWCAPCRAAVPELKAIYEKYKAKGFEIVGVANDSKEESWRKAVNDDQSGWIHVIDEFPIQHKPSKVSTQYAIHYLPSYFLIAPDGKMIGKFEKAELKERLKEIFEK